MDGLSLDDTLHAVVQVTHEHGLPLSGANVIAGNVLVYTATADVGVWARWLTDVQAAACRHVVWETEDTNIAFHLNATREGIAWTVVSRPPVDVAAPILAAHGIALTERHVDMSADAAIALTDAISEQVLA